MLYYHLFGTCREKPLNGLGDSPGFWRTSNPISWDKNPKLDIVTFDKFIGHPLIIFIKARLLGAVGSAITLKLPI